MGNNLKTTITEASDWRLVAAPLDQLAAGQQLVRSTDFVYDMTTVEGLMDTLVSTANYTQPYADGIRWGSASSVWVNSNSEIVENEQRHCAIRQTLTLVTTIANEAALPSTYIDLDTRQTLKVFCLQEGVESVIARQWLYLNPASQATIWGLTMSSFLPSGYAEKDRRVAIEERGDRTCTFTVLFKKVVWSNTTPTGVVTAEYGNNSANKEGRRRRDWYSGVPIASAAGFVQTLKANVTDGSDTYPVAVVEMHEAGDGEAVITRLRQCTNDSVQTTDYLIDELSVDTATGLKDGILQVWPNISATSAGTLISGFGATFSDGGTTYTYAGYVRRRDPDTGLVTLFRKGRVNVGSRSWNADTYHAWPYKQWFETVGNTLYRVTLGRRVASSFATAATYANLATATNWRPANRGSQGDLTQPGGSITKIPSTDMWEAILEYWETGQTDYGAPTEPT